MDLPERLLPRVHSRLGIRRVNFLPYDRIALASIIADRLGGLAAFEADGVELCSRKVASVSGDVRRALEVCRLATTLAERDDLAAYNRLEAEKKSVQDELALAAGLVDEAARVARTWAVAIQASRPHSAGPRGASPSLDEKAQNRLG